MACSSHQFNLQLPCNQRTSLHIFALSVSYSENGLFLFLAHFPTSFFSVLLICRRSCTVQILVILGLRYCSTFAQSVIWSLSSFLTFYFVLGHSRFSVLWYFQVNSEGTQPYTHMYPFSSWSLSLTIVSLFSCSWRDHVNLEPYDCAFGIFKEVLHL